MKQTYKKIHTLFLVKKLKLLAGRIIVVQIAAGTVRVRSVTVAIAVAKVLCHQVRVRCGLLLLVLHHHHHPVGYPRLARMLQFDRAGSGTEAAIALQPVAAIGDHERRTEEAGRGAGGRAGRGAGGRRGRRRRGGRRKGRTGQGMGGRVRCWRGR